MQTLVARDVTLNNNFTLKPAWQRSSEGRKLTFGFGIEKILARNLDIEMDGEWDSISPRHGRSGGGFGNVDLLLRWVVLTTHAFQFALAPELSFPTNSHIADEEMSVSAGASFIWGGRLTSLPKHGWLAYLRAIEIQGDLGYSRGFDRGRSDEVFLDPVVDYSFPYLSYSTDAAIPWPVGNLYPFTELNFDQVILGTARSVPSLYDTLGISYVAENYQLAIAVELPLKRSAERRERVALLGQFIVFLDALEPRFAWTPF